MITKSMNLKNRTVFSNDNLPVLRGIDTESIDLIYLDPPFNSNRNYAAPIGSDAAGAAFKDTWTLSDVDNAWHGEIADQEPALSQAIRAAELTHGTSSNQGDVVLDPFCGCATTCVAAEQLQRHWIGIDISPKAVDFVRCD